MLDIVTSNESRSHIALIGKLDTNTSSQLGRYFDQLQNDELGDVRIDMTRCEFVSSAGLRIIMAIQKRVNNASGGMVLYAVQPNIMEVFDRVLTFR